MEYVTLGQTGLRMSVAGLGGGGNSRMGMGKGKTQSSARAMPIICGRISSRYSDRRCPKRTAKSSPSGLALTRGRVGASRSVFEPAHTRGFFIKTDYYNGLNFAFLLNVRAAHSQGDDAIADRVLAKRIRQEVLTRCDQALQDTSLSDDGRFWVHATQVEALFGLARPVEAEALKRQLLTQQPPAASWMMNSMNGQVAKLARLQP